MARRHVLMLSAALAAGCATNPVTGKSQLSLISESQEIQMGREAAQQTLQQIGEVKDPGLQAYVSRIGKELAARTERPQLPWEFHVVDDASVNAFALPGGFIFVTRGLMTYMNNEAELATVLGHEIGHVTNRHSVSQISKAQVAQLGLGIGSILSPTVAKYGQLAGAGLSILFLQYSRDAENEADLAGFRYALNDNYDVRQMSNVFQTLDRLDAATGGQGKLPNWLSTHPAPANRIANTQARLDTLHKSLANARVNRDGYLQQINGLVFGEDPRQGFFRNGVFLHPDLRFQLTFPSDWKTQNTAQAVIAASPNQDAVIQLTLGQGSPSAAAQQFFSQQGVQSNNVSNTTINGLPAVAGYFQAQTDQGVVAGLVTFISYGNATYQILGYTPAAGMSQYDAVFRRTMGSFGPLTDQSALNVQPAKVELVRVPSAMTVQEFNSRYPSSIPIAQVAIINEAGADGRLTAGQMAKRVTGGVR
ncbi:MAG: M48 family metalloprotease [Bacillota bacterium]|jgi:predicted Zn-dependent protease